MGRAVAAACIRTLPDGVRDAVRDRIGEERFAVWFGDASWNPMVDGGPGVVLRVGAGVTHEWLKRTFRADIEAAARMAHGPGARVVWEPAATNASSEALTSANRSSPRRTEGDPTGIAVHSDSRLAVADGASVSSVAPTSPRRSARVLGELVVGPCNRMGFAAVEIAASRPGEISPLFIHGPSGVGKSHLLEAACNLSRQRHPGLHTVFVSAEQFTTSFLQALHGGGLPGFRRSIRTADMLAIDDFQFFVGKRATIQELQQTIDALHRQGKQIVIGCDKEIDALGDLGNDLLGRLRGGMVARLLPPDYEVRRGIVAALARGRELALSDDVVHHVATHMIRHARELAGAVNRLEATSHMLGLPITLELAQEALADLVRSSGRCLRLADIERAVCAAFAIEAGGLQSSSRSRAVSHPRMLAMYLARKHTRAALAEIGSYFGRRSHSTVVTAQKTVAEWLSAKTPIILSGAAWDVAEAIRRVEDGLRS